MEFLEGSPGETSLHKEVSPVSHFFEGAFLCEYLCVQAEGLGYVL